MTGRRETPNAQLQDPWQPRNTRIPSQLESGIPRTSVGLRRGCYAFSGADRYVRSVYEKTLKAYGGAMINRPARLDLIKIGDPGLPSLSHTRIFAACEWTTYKITLVGLFTNQHVGMEIGYFALVQYVDEDVSPAQASRHVLYRGYNGNTTGVQRGYKRVRRPRDRDGFLRVCILYPARLRVHVQERQQGLESEQR